jgi:hypothetical protein
MADIRNSEEMYDATWPELQTGMDWIKRILVCKKLRQEQKAPTRDELVWWRFSIKKDKWFCVVQHAMS